MSWDDAGSSLMYMWGSAPIRAKLAECLESGGSTESQINHRSKAVKKVHGHCYPPSLPRKGIDTTER